jgi:chemotaxis protein histidine kinase CheA
MSLSNEFNASVYVSEQLNRQLVNMSQDVAYRCVKACAEHYHFDAEEAYRLLGLGMLKVERKKEKEVKKTAKVLTPKAAFPLPYNGEFNENCCNALRQNNGLYTQCTGIRKGENQFCKSCSTTMQKTGAELPEYGTIQQRMAVGILEYVDPKGRKPIAYTKVMKKYKVSQEQVLEEAGKLNIIINPIHFEIAEPESVKRGRPSSKANKEVKVKGVKGRPKKEKKVLVIEGDDGDLFDTLVKNASQEPDEPIIDTDALEKQKAAEKAEKAAKLAAEKAEKAAKLEAEKKEKAAKLAAEKAEKEAKLAAEKAEKEAKKEAERLAREAKKKAEEEEKAAKKAAAEKAKAEKESKKSKKSSKPAPVEEEEEEEEEEEVVKRITFEGKKYLKSVKSGLIYDHDEYAKNQERVVVGKWNTETEKIDFNEKEDDEEEEDEYEE